MDSVLIIGVETVAGANCAVVFSERFRVVGLTSCNDVSIEGCEVRTCKSHDATTTRQLIQQVQPKWILFCGTAARSTWDFETDDSTDDIAAVGWAGAAKDAGISFTLLSSDAVFTGPWISHDEEDEHFCETPRAKHVRRIEEDVFTKNDEALVVRTNVFGWSPLSDCSSFAERLVAGLVDNDVSAIDFIRHASPILATDLAAMLLQAFDADTIGLLHLSGGERINPYSFALRLAGACNLPRPQIPQTVSLTSPVVGFGLGETTLDCSLARELLGVRLPLIEDGLQGLVAQQTNGHCEKLRAGSRSISKAA